MKQSKFDEQGKWNRLQSYVAGVHFRYKIAAYVLAAIVLVCGLYTFLVLETMGQLSQQINVSIEASERVASMSRELHQSALTSELLSEFQDEAFLQALEKRSTQIDAQYEEMKQRAHAHMARLSSQKRIFWIWTLGIGIVIAVLVFFSVVLSRRLASPLEELQNMMEEVSRGESPKKSPRDSRVSGEIQALQGSLMKMLGVLRMQKKEMLSEINAILIELESPSPRKGLEKLRRLVKTAEAQLKDSEI